MRLSTTRMLAALVGALALGAPGARAAEAGVNVSNPNAAQLSEMRTLGTKWVRMFVDWREV